LRSGETSSELQIAPLRPPLLLLQVRTASIKLYRYWLPAQDRACDQARLPSNPSLYCGIILPPDKPLNGRSKVGAASRVAQITHPHQK
jgi:hypothetical protein